MQGTNDILVVKGVNNVKVVYVFSSIILIIITIIILVLSNNHPSLEKQLANLDLSDVDKVMFVAHPDDETIWGGAHLLQDKYLVVCMTCGTNKIRDREITKAMAYSHDELIMLGYPDKFLGIRSYWRNEFKSIVQNVRTILNYKDWKVVVTHNPQGEYGHQQHQLTSKIVTDIYGQKDNLYYFGKYYRKSKLKVTPKGSNLNKNVLHQKINKMLPIYKSQTFIDRKFGHMYPLEEWKKSTDKIWKQKPLPALTKPIKIAKI